MQRNKTLMGSANKFAPARTTTGARNAPARTLAQHALDAMLDKKAHDLLVIDMRRVSGVADYFVLGTGDSDLQVKAIVDAVRDRIREQCGERPWHTEGYEHRQWVLLDYVDLVVHVFSDQRRSFYNLERLWGDAPTEQVPDDAASAAEVKLLQGEQRP